MAFVKICSVQEISPGQGKPFEINGEEIAVFNVDGEFFAISNSCPHRNGPLGEGMLDGDVVSCPMHGWRFNIRNGQGVTIPTSKVPCFGIRVEGNDVLVDL